MSDGWDVWNEGLPAGGGFHIPAAGAAPVPAEATVGKFSISVVDEQLGRCFAEVVRALEESLKELGRWAPNGRPIVFGASPQMDLQADAIVFETEQPARHLWHVPRPQVAWTFSEYIAKHVQGIGTHRVVLCPVGYHASMSTIVPGPVGEEVIDVLFYGTLNDHRKAVLDQLQSAGLRVVYPDKGAFGATRDALIAQAKVVLNLHYYRPAVFEIFRVAHLLANGRAVVSEGGGQDKALEDLAASCTSLVPYEQVVNECVRLARDDSARRALAETGGECFRRTLFVENVRRALAETDGLT